MATGVLTIAELVVNKPDYVKLKDAAGKSWNCNEQRLLRNAKDGKPVFSVGRQLQVEYKESQPVGQRFPARWINDVALAPAGTSDTFQPHGEGHGSGMKSNGEFRTPEQIMRGQSLECAASFAKSAEEALEVARTFFYPYIFGEFEPRDELAVAAATVAEVLPVTPVEDDESEYPF